MHNSPQYRSINIPGVQYRNRAAREVIAAHAPKNSRLIDINAALDDTISLLIALRTTIQELPTTRQQRANLAAAILATLNADRDGDADPLYYIRDEMRAQGYLPPDNRGRA